MIRTESEPGRRSRLARLALKGLAPVAILCGAAAMAVALVGTAPEAARQPPPRAVRMVDVEPVRLVTEPVTIEAMGTVTAARRITLQPRVAGPVAWVSPDFVPGGVFKAGEKMLALDGTDLDLVVAQREAALADAESDLSIEKGQQAIARREYELAGRRMTDEEKALVLRQPQLASVEAAVRTARANLTQARLDLARVSVAAPFDSIVEDRSVDVGAQVTTATALATLIGTDRAWVELSVPVDQLKWIVIPRVATERGSAVRIHNDLAWGAAAIREGHVVRLAGALEENGRMARLLVAVEDPLALRPENAGRPALLIDTYVRAEIEGRPVGPAAALARERLRDNDTVWVLDDGDTLRIRKVAVLHRGAGRVFVGDGLAEGDRVIATDLGVPVDGQALRARDAKTAAPARESRR